MRQSSFALMMMIIIKRKYHNINSNNRSSSEVRDNNLRRKSLFAYHPESVRAVNRRRKKPDIKIHTYLWPRYSDVDKKHMTQTRGTTDIMVSNHKKRGIIKGGLAQVEQRVDVTEGWTSPLGVISLRVK